MAKTMASRIPLGHNALVSAFAAVVASATSSLCISIFTPSEPFSSTAAPIKSALVDDDDDDDVPMASDVMSAVDDEASIDAMEATVESLPPNIATTAAANCCCLRCCSVCCCCW